MLAYHNNPTIKQQILEQLQGSSWNISIEDFESRFGIPVRLAHLEDAIFEGLPNEEAKNWPIRFMSSIQVGADLSAVWREFALWMLVDPADGVIKFTTPGTEVYQAVMQVATLYRDGYTQQQMNDAAVTARAAALAALADYNAAKAAAAGFASDAAASALDAAASALDAAASFANDAVASYAAALAATSALDAAASFASDAAASYAAALDAAYAASYIKISNKIIDLLEKQEVKHDHK